MPYTKRSRRVTYYSGGPLGDGRSVSRIHYDDGTVEERIHPARPYTLIILPRPSK